MKNDFNMCPMCGSKKIENKGNRKWICPDCGYDLYCNVAAAVGIVIRDKQDNILFEVRAKEPRKGLAAVPGGFVDFDESAEEAAIRECKEEIGVDIKSVRFLCSFPNTYVYKNVEYKTCDIFFLVDLPDQFDSMESFIAGIRKQESEVESVCYYKVSCPEDIDKIPLAFDSARKTLLKLLESEKRK